MEGGRLDRGCWLWDPCLILLRLDHEPVDLALGLSPMSELCPALEIESEDKEIRALLLR